MDNGSIGDVAPLRCFFLPIREAVTGPVVPTIAAVKESAALPVFTAFRPIDVVPGATVICACPGVKAAVTPLVPGTVTVAFVLAVTSGLLCEVAVAVNVRFPGSA